MIQNKYIGCGALEYESFFTYGKLCHVGLPSNVPTMSPTPPVKKSRFKASREGKTRQSVSTQDMAEPEHRIDSKNSFERLG